MISGLLLTNKKALVNCHNKGNCRNYTEDFVVPVPQLKGHILGGHCGGIDPAVVWHRNIEDTAEGTSDHSAHDRVVGSLGSKDLVHIHQLAAAQVHDVHSQHGNIGEMVLCAGSGVGVAHQLNSVASSEGEGVDASRDIANPVAVPNFHQRALEDSIEEDNISPGYYRIHLPPQTSPDNTTPLAYIEKRRPG